MTDSDAEEITIVLKDGTVHRWKGKQAQFIWSGMQTADGEYFSLCVEAWDRAYHPTLAPTTTKPLRRVEKVVGWVDNDFPGTICLERTGPGEVNAVQIDCVVPDECIAKGDEEPKTYRFRFVAEAEAVEEKGR